MRADFARTRDLLSRRSVAVFRITQFAYRRKKALRKAAALLDLLWLRVVVGAELPPSVECGPGLRLPHVGRGVVHNPRVVIGANATIYHRVTLGVIGPDKTNVPTLGDDVYLGTDATVLARVDVGDGAKIAAGAVVMKDVPASATAVGPAAVVLHARPRPL